MPAAPPPVRILVLFEKEWDAPGFAPLVAAGEVEIHREGFDLFRFPENARVMVFDAWRFVEAMCAKYGGRIDAVISGDEQFGALLAAVIAERLGLAGNDPAALARAQHKLLCRRIQARVAPQAAAAAQPLPFELSDRRVRDPIVLEAALGGIGVGFPLFVKPVKATFSVLARRVASAHELAAHLSFGWLERRIIAQLVAPYAALAARYVELPCHPTRMLIEEPIVGHQINVDGFAYDGRVTLMGIVDEWMYPGEAGGAKHFLRFGYPSVIGAAVRAQVERLVPELMQALGHRLGFFNCELFVDAQGGVRFIEVNPRLAVQFVGMYRDCEGYDIYRMMVAMALGRDPLEVPRLPATCTAAGSFVFRRFDGSAGPRPAEGSEAWLAARFPGAELTQYHKRGRSLAREYKWLGSHRYALLNMAARDEAQLRADFELACARLGWPACYDSDG